MKNINLLPVDGELYYYPNFLSASDADFYFDELHRTIEWEHDVVKLFGKTIQTKRKVAWYATEALSYKYSGMMKHSKNFTKDLIELKEKIESFAEENFNACLLNLYSNGSEGMAWHSDDEKEIVHHSCIASLSLGAKRRFDFKHKINGDKFCIDLEHGSLLLMKSDIQEHWLHALPKQLRVKEARINLTFRLNKNG